MKEQVSKIAQVLNSVLNQQGFSTKRNAIFQILEDFESSTLGEMERDFDNNDFDDLDDLSKNVNVYIDLKKLINENSNNKIDFENGFTKIISVYDYYEQKYIRELKFRNDEQRRNYIESILSPLILISLFFEEQKTNINYKKNQMFRASIFQKNILSKSDKSDFVESFQNCLVDIDESRLNIYNEETIILKSELTKIEDDVHTITYKGNYKDNEAFRVIRPKDIALENVKKQHSCISAFSIASISPSGYAIHFILTEKDDIRNINSVEKGYEEQIQRLIEGCILALQNELYQNFVDYSKRLLNLIKTGSELLNYQHGDGILLVMKNNDEQYTSDEKIKIYR